MHELSVCQSLLDQVSQIASDHHAAVVDRIYLQVGPLSGVEPELLQSAFPIARANTVAAHAELVIEMLPIKVKCQICAAETDANMNKLVCAECGDWHTELVSGDELLLERVELRTEH
jgi:hydrogenase nickel incorporation protein HypA/HybF